MGEQVPIKSLRIGDLYYIEKSRRSYLLVGLVKEVDVELLTTVRLFWLDSESGIVYTSNYPVTAQLNIVSRCEG